jgi:streptogramin lyase
MPSRLPHSRLTSLCRSWFGRVPVRTAQSRSSGLRIESLEDRVVPSLTTLVPGLQSPEGVAVDNSGNVYIAETGNQDIKEWVKSSNTLITLVPTGLKLPEGVAVDSSGNVYIADAGSDAIDEWVASSQTLITLVSSSSGMTSPVGVAVDGNGNVYIADNGGNAIDEWVASSQTFKTVVSSGLTNPSGVAIDGNGNLYIADYGDGAVKEWVASSQTLTTLYSSGTPGLSFPFGVALDGRGNVYFSDAANDVVNELNASSQTVSTLASAGLNVPLGIAVDSSNNLYIADYSAGAIQEFDLGPVITAQPQNMSATIDQAASASFTVTANGAAPLSYQWQISTDNGASFSNLSDGNGIGGSTTPTLTVSDFAITGSAEYQVIVTDANGVTVTSNAAALTVNAAPSITTQPHDAVATVGQTGAQSFSIADNGGTGTLSVQWQVSTDNGQTFSNLSNGNGIAGATSTTLTISSIDTAGSPEYRAVVTDANGVTATSSAATLTIDAAPSITAQPANQSATTGQAGAESFSVTAANGTGSLTYQWQESTDGGQTFSNVSDGSGLSGATTATLTISGFATPESAEYQAVVTDANGVSVTSNAAALTVNAAPSITTQPQNATAAVGQSASEFFSIADNGGTGPLSVQWQDSTDGGNTFTNLSDGNGVSGSTTPTLTISSFTSAGSAVYRAVVTDANQVSVTSNAATLTVDAAPSIADQPVSESATAGQTGSESFSVVATSGTSPDTYQWQVSTDGGNTYNPVSDGSGISGAATPTLTISGNALPASGAEYDVVVTDANGIAVTSNAAALTVNAAPSITTQPQNATATVGQTASESFSIADSGGTGALSVQWQVSTDGGNTFTNLSDGNGVSGSASTTLTINGFTSAGSAEYRAVVTDANGVAATSDPATLAVNAVQNPADPNQAWLTQVYADVLHRPLDSSGQATWIGALNQGYSRTQVVQFIESGLEYRTDAVEALYTQLLHRAADQAGLDGFLSFLGNGGSIEQVEAAILGSAEYYQMHGGTNDGFLSAVYQDVLNRSLDANGAQSWGTQLASGTSTGAVAGSILTSLEAETDEVQSDFNQFLHRSADPAGLNGFTTALQQGASNEVVIAAMVGSDEYFSQAEAQ